MVGRIFGNHEKKSYFALFLSLILPLKTKRRGFLKQVITSKKQRTMKTRIIYVGTLLDLAMMVEPDEELDEEVEINMLNIKYNKV
jgi:hypothetical protein